MFSNGELLKGSPVRGSLWRPWDLHVHTPYSIVQHYGGITKWDKYLEDLEALPNGTVLGINDYLLVDGLERLLAERQNGRLANIAALFPVIELRLSNLVGTKNHLSKINAHVIFAETITPSEINGQFLTALSAKAHLNPEDPAECSWTGVISRENLEEFGKLIKQSVPDAQKADYNKSDLETGFNGLAIPIETVEAALGHARFVGNAILAVGKAEWESMAWNAQSGVLKSTLMNQAHLVFGAAPDVETHNRGRERLVDAGVNSRLVHASDAHYFSVSEEERRIGQSLTWVNTDPTFTGLLHAVTEFDHRFFTGDEPPQIQSLRRRPSSYIRQLTVRKLTDDSSSHEFFNIALDLNPGFVAIVGNKGQGKSALLDIIGLFAGSRNSEHFTFLNAKRFLHPIENPGSHYEGEISWFSGDSMEAMRLDKGVQADSVEQVTYLPQRLIDTICSSDPEAVEAQKFSHCLLYTSPSPRD